ncbi:MAG: hypothetical protein OSA99_14785 [Acidimicrobiales bacterium]|nr:hypothetical protein [Acidimicrobiales bacterium]
MPLGNGIRLQPGPSLDSERCCLFVGVSDVHATRLDSRTRTRSSFVQSEASEGTHGPLSGLDTTFLTFETPSVHMRVAQTAIFDAPAVPGGYEFAKIKEHIPSRLHLVPPFRRRLVEVPFNLHHPLWVEDPDFDPDYHVRRIGVLAPGALRGLSELAGRIAPRPLDRSRPLWETYVFEGMENDRIGVITKMHHCAVDGVSRAELMTNLFDLSAEGEDMSPPDEREPERVPTDAELIAFALKAGPRTPSSCCRW